MATNTRVKGGYNYKFTEDPPDGLKCMICLNVARQPQQHGECGKLFCMSCITQHRQIDSKCPHCRLQLSTFYDGKSDQEVKALKIRCTNMDEGCQWVGELHCLNEHFIKCDYVLVFCSNKCTRDKQTVQVQRKDLNHHLSNDCLRRQYKCPHCNEAGVYVERITTHLDTCSMVEVHCPNPECNHTSLRRDLPLHNSVCEHQTASCKFAEFGCKVTQTKLTLKMHEEDDQQHLQLTKEKVLELTKQLEQQRETFASQIEQHSKEISAIQRNLRSCKKHTSPTIFRLKRFNYHRQENTVLCSAPFYSSQDGYKFHVAVHANGNGNGRGTHISLFAHLEKGVNDDSLAWPFKGSITVELLNQLENKKNTKWIIDFPENEEVSGRVIDGKEQAGWGKPALVPHSALEYRRFAQCQYLKDDTIFFRISVQVSNYKPWLECST